MRDQPPEADEAGAIVAAEAGAIVASEAGAIVAVDAGAIVAAEAGAMVAVEAGAIVASEAGAMGAADEVAALEAAVTAGAAGGLLKIQIRPMMTITATMMMIQVLRFMRDALGCWNVDREELYFLPDAWPLPVIEQPGCSAVIGGIQFRRRFGVVRFGVAA